jgi:RNA polymerase sigma-70 factor (ECF subfamily)
MADTDIDAALTRRLAVDHREAFADYVGEYQHGIYAGLRRLTGSPRDAEDLAQETFVRAFKAFEKYDANRIAALQLRGWTWTIALNLARNAARTRSRRPVTVAATWDRPEDADEPERLVETDAWSQRLAALSLAQRTAVVLRHVLGLSYDEIAEATGRALGTVKTDVHRGIARLQAIIEEEAA